MAPLRVCLLTPAFPPAIGGQEAHALELAENLMAQGAAVQVLTKRLGHEYIPREVMRGMSVTRLSPVGELKALGWHGLMPIALYLANTTLHLLRRAREYDVILVSGFNLLPLTAAFVKVLTGKPCVVRPESPLEMREAIGSESLSKMGLSGNSLLFRFIASLRHNAARRIDRYVAISDEIRQALIQAGIDPARIVSIPNGIDTEKFAPIDVTRRRDLRRELGLPVDRHLLIYTGRLAVSKGVLMLAEVWKELAQEFGDTHLVLVGTGAGSHDNCETELRSYIATSGLEATVTFTGNVPDVHRYLQVSDSFVFPSDSEGFGLSIIEAMAVGLPMVSTRVGVAAELSAADAAALIVPAKNRTELLEALRRLMRDAALRRTLSENAQKTIHARYSMNVVARRYLDIFRELTGRSGNTAATVSSHPAPGS